MKLTSTNKPTTCHNHTSPMCRSTRVHYAVPRVRSVRSHLHRVSAVIAKGKDPVPFRTRKLSSSAPMVMRGGPRGRVGRRRTCTEEGRSPHRVERPSSHARKPLSGPASTIPVSWPATAWSRPRRGYHRGLLARARGCGRGSPGPGVAPVRDSDHDLFAHLSN